MSTRELKDSLVHIELILVLLVFFISTSSSFCALIPVNLFHSMNGYREPVCSFSLLEKKLLLFLHAGLKGRSQEC